jgi:succinyl-CoA synthetase alpha subunit
MLPAHRARNRNRALAQASTSERRQRWHKLRDPAGLAGNVGIVSQSGAFCITLLTDIRRFGFSHVVSSSNKAVLVAADYLEYLADDPHTRVIGSFIETIRSPGRFVAALDRAAALGKPVVALKVGQTERTRRAVTTHTGGLAGDPGCGSRNGALPLRCRNQEANKTSIEDKAGALDPHGVIMLLSETSW